MNFTGPELLTIQYAFSVIMVTAPKYFHETGGKLISDAAAFFQRNPNATNHQIATFLGSSDDTAAALSAATIGYLPGAAGEGLQAFVDYLNSTLPYLPKDETVTPPGFDAVIFILMALMLIVVAGRIYSRHTIMGGLLMSDWAILVGTAVTLTFVWMTWINYTYYLPDLGYWGLTNIQYVKSQEYSFALWLMVLIMLLAIKTSILLFYYQLTNWRPLRIAVWATFTLITTSSITGFFGFIFLCKPILWWTAMSAVCINNGGLVLVVVGFVNVFTDFILWLIPLPLLFKLPVPKKDRNWSVAIFGFALISCAAAAVKLYYIYNAWVGTLTLQEFMGGTLTLMGDIEPQVAIICASLPAWRPLARRWAPRLVSNEAEAAEMRTVVPKAEDIEAANTIVTLVPSSPDISVAPAADKEAATASIEISSEGGDLKSVRVDSQVRPAGRTADSEPEGCEWRGA